MRNLELSIRYILLLESKAFFSKIPHNIYLTINGYRLTGFHYISIIDKNIFCLFPDYFLIKVFVYFKTVFCYFVVILKIILMLVLVDAYERSLASLFSFLGPFVYKNEMK